MRQITVEELKAKLDSGENLHIIDVREPSEYEEYNIGAQLIPLGNIVNFQIDDIENLKNEELIIHCKAGSRSAQACMILEQAGFTNTVNVIGGVTAWREKYGDAKIK
ncbi:MAG: rhodanese-like domain-containing protein [Sphingobacteriales bacterium]|nr:MAG: rhodanese-like domain-containing protein [Sphingobacteriales bacterium]